MTTSSPTTPDGPDEAGPPTDLAFAQTREDPALEAALARGLGRPARVLLLCSGGCTPLALLGEPAVATLDAVDASAAQLHLAELKRAAVGALAVEDVAALLGAAPGDAPARARRYAALRPRLPEATRAHWDARPAEVAFGLHRAGRFEGLFRALARALAAEGLRPLAAPAAATAHPRWAATFERVFEREVLARTFGRAAVDYSMSQSFGAHFARVFAEALARFEGRDRSGWTGESWFLRAALEDRYLDARPPWLEPAGHAAARRLGLERLRLHRGAFLDLLEPLAAAGGPFDLVQTSNITDWMPAAALDDLVRRVAACLAPGGVLLARRLNGDHDLAAVVGRRLRVDRAEGEALRARDRSFFYSEVVVGRAPP